MIPVGDMEIKEQQVVPSIRENVKLHNAAAVLHTWKKRGWISTLVCTFKLSIRRVRSFE